MAEQYKGQGLVVLAVNHWDEPASTLKRFVTESKLSHQILLDGNEVGRSYGVTGVPVTFWIDATGVVKEVDVGWSGKPKKLHERANALLKAS